jgi:multidrug resistance efflux pump
MISPAEYDQYSANYFRARGRADAARAKSEMMFRGSRPQEKAEAKALLDQARANYDLLKAGTRPEDIAMIRARRDVSRAKLDELDAQLSEAVVKAPSRAVIDVLPVRKGDVLTPNQTVARILSAADLWVKVYVPETDLGKVRLDQPAEVTVDSYPGRRFRSKVYYIGSQSEFTPRNIQSIDERRHQVFGIKVRVTDPAAEGVFKSGMAATVFVPIS